MKRFSTYQPGRMIPSLTATRQDQKAAKIYGIPEQIFTFMYLGNIGPVAGVTLIRSFAEAALPDAQLVIAGDGTAAVLLPGACETAQTGQCLFCI